MLPGKRVLNSMTAANSFLRVDGPLMTFRGASRICVQLALALLLFLGSTNFSDAQDNGCPSCKTSKAWVPIGLYAKACARYPYEIRIEGNTVAVGSGICTADGWTSADRILVDLKPDVTYQFSVDAGETCASHFNFYDIPDGYKLEIDGVETTTIDKVSNRAYGGNGSWNVVVRESCDSCGSGPSGTPAGPDLGSILWGVGLGNLSDGRSAGSLSIRESQLTATSYTPDALIYSPPGHTNEVDITQNAGGNHRQIKAPESLADILVTSSTEYDIRFYRGSDVGSKDASGLYILTGSPYVTYTIKNPDPASLSRFQILKSESGGPAEVSEYTWDSLIDVWTLNRNNGARIETKLISYPTDTSRTETIIVKEGSQVLSKVSKTYHTYSFGEELVQKVVDPDGAALTTTYTYFEDPNEIRWHKIKSISYADGSWIKYDYDNNGNVSLILRPWEDLTLTSATEENARATRYTYSNTDGINTSFTPRFVSTITEKIAGTVVGTTTYARTATSINGNPAVIETERVYSSVGNSLATLTTRYHSSAAESLAGRVVSVEYPDGRKATYTYETGNYVPNPDPALSQFTVDPIGLAEQESVIEGTTSSPDGIAFKTAKKTTIRDQFGNQVFEETYVNTGAGYERIGWTAHIYDGRGHVTQTIRHNSQIVSAVWNGDRQVSAIDESGIETTYTYDPLGRIRTSTKKGIAAGGGFPAQTDIVTTTIYDAEGHLTVETLSGGGLTLSKFNTYDLAGRIKTATDQAGLVTSYSYSNGGRTQSVTRPGGATENTDAYLDGQNKSVTGTAVVAKYFDYGVNADGTHYSQEFVGSAGLDSPRWIKSTTDWMGRTVSLVKPSFTGTNLVKTSIYNALGQLQKQTTTVNSTKLIADQLYQYDELGQQILSGSDIDGSGTLTLLSTDRLTETDIVYEKVGNDWFRVTSTRTYLTDNNDTPVIQTQRERLNNFTLNGTEQTVSEVTTTDVAGNNTKTTTTTDRAAKKQTTTTDTSDSNVNAVSISVNGLLQSSSPATPQTATTYTYDSLGRQIGVTDPRTGTTSRTYNSTTGELATTTEGEGTTIYEYYDAKHVNAGHLKSQTNAAGKKIYFNYNNRGELTQTWGDATYPLEYVYDAYAQRTELRTFRAGQNWAASVWPASTTGTSDVTKWIYQESTGLLTQKQDAALKGPIYTYDELGRQKTRVWARGITCTYGYDVNTGELRTVTYSDSTPAVSIAYDRGGRQKDVTDAAGSHTRTFNVAGEMQTEQVTGGILDGVGIIVGYDGFLRRNSLQTSLGANTLSGQTYGYDPTSRLETITSGSQTATYAYYPNSGLLNTTTFTGGTNIARSYDGFGRLQNIITTPAADTAQSYAYTYNNLNQRTRVTREDSSNWSYIYNDRGELVSGKKYWSDNSIVWGSQTEYKFDNLGNRIQAKNGGNQLGGLRESNYTTNSRNQYTQRTVPGAIDLSGTANAGATVSVNSQPTARKGQYFFKELVVDNSGVPSYPQIQIVGARNNFGAGGEDAVTQKGGRAFLPPSVESLTIDDDGNLSSDGRWNYSWDGENRLSSVEAVPNLPVEAKRRVEFVYDSMGRRIQKKVYDWNSSINAYQLQSSIRFVYDAWNLIAELDSGNVPIRRYVWGTDHLLLINAATDSYQAGYDGNQNITSLIDATTGTSAGTYDYDPFGNAIQVVGAYAEQNPFRFSNKYSDTETGLIYYGHRYYAPATGRWISRDPIDEEGGINLYAFVQNNPINDVDLLGLRGLTDYAHEKMWELFNNHGHEVGSNFPGYKRGRQDTNCITYVRHVLEYAYRKIGRRDVADAIHRLPKDGMPLANYLVSLGWKPHYWNPDVNRPRDGENEHPFSYNTVVKTGRYYGLEVSGVIINYNPTPAPKQGWIDWLRGRPAPKATPLNYAAFGRFNGVKFAYGLARGAFHTFLYSYGEIFEVHWTEEEDRLYERSPFYSYDWLSGLMLTPPDSAFTSDRR